MGITILGTGHHVPGVPVTNDQLSAVMETSDEWIYPRTGIKQRHFVAEGEGVSDLALKASQRALANAGVDAEEVDFIVFATMTPEFIFPGAGGLLGAKLGIPRVPALDIRQQCAAMPFGMQVANGLVATGAAKTVLLVGADAHAGFMPWEDWDVLYGESDRPVSQEAMERGTRHRGLAVLFGDGAAAMVLREGGEDRGFLGADLHTDGRLFDRIYIASGGFRSRPYFTPEMYEREEHIPKMQGRDLFKVAVTELSRSVRTVCEKCDVTLDDVDWFIAHQANDRINGAVRQALKLPESKVPSNIAKYGNTSAATIGLLLDELRRGGEVKEGQLICFLALGSGLNWGSVLMRL